MKVRIKAVTEMLAAKPMWQDHPGARPRPVLDAPTAPSRFRIEVETLDQVSAEELARLEVGTADWADLAFPDRRRTGIVVPECSIPLDVRCVCHAQRDQLLDAVERLQAVVAVAVKNIEKAVDLALLYEKAGREARAVLREVESGNDTDFGRFCPSCGAFREDDAGTPAHPHKPDCRLAAVLRDAPPQGCWCEEDYQGDGLCPTCRGPANPWSALKGAT